MPPPGPESQWEYMTGLPVIAKVQDNAKDLDIDADVLAEFYDEVKIK